MNSKKQRLDTILLQKSIAADKDEAFVMITEGRVRVEGQKAVSPAQVVSPDADIEVRGVGERYVGRGAEKLEGAMERFGVSVQGKICADIGVATGGFSEVLLRRGAAKVYAIDTARGKLALKIREDARVVVMESTDVRDLATLPEKVALAVIDVSLISLRNILPHVGRLLAPDGKTVALFKPQYETRDSSLLHHGIIRDTASREKLLADFRVWLQTHGWIIHDWMQSPITGSKGNIEYLFYLKLAL